MRARAPFDDVYLWTTDICVFGRLIAIVRMYYCVQGWCVTGAPRWNVVILCEDYAMYLSGKYRITFFEKSHAECPLSTRSTDGELVK